MVSTKTTRRGGNTAPNAMKGDEQHIMLARGLSARYTGANAPLSGLTSEEMERDIRHMEAFANACTAYSQQYFIFQNSQEEKDSSEGGSGSAGPAGAGLGGLRRTGTTPSTVPLVAMPVRIDPEEEKRLFQLRTKIQQCEAQREVLESQYLSLRAHYVHLSKVLVKFRGTVNVHVELLQGLVQKRGKLLGLQRVRLQIVREVLASLKYRQSHPLLQLVPEKENTNTNSNTTMDEEEQEVNLVVIWNTLDEQITKAAQDCRSDGVEAWHALKVPRTPPGVPILLSQLATKPGHGVGFGLSGAFGTFPNSMCWLESNLPKAPTPGIDLPVLREQVGILQKDLDNERNMNKELQSDIIARRKRNDELVAMMTLLRTETEAVVARHNILLDSDQAKDAAYNLHQKDQQLQIKNKQEAAANALVASAAAAETVPADTTTTAAVVGVEGATTTATLAPETGDAKEGALVPADAAAPEAPVTTTTATTATTEAHLETSSTTTTPAPPVSTESGAAVAEPTVSRLADDENDGDDEGEIEEDDDEEGEILEQGQTTGPKRPLEEEGELEPTAEQAGGSPRSAKRRKV
jgi:hypothetical protein